MSIWNQNLLSELVTSVDLKEENIFYHGKLFCFNLIKTLSFFKKKLKYFNSVTLIFCILFSCIL